MLALLTSRRFGPFFAAQFLGAANDNLFKNALVILVLFKLGGAFGLAPGLLVTLAAGLFILPFFLFSAVAGEIADAREKARLVRFWKTAEVPIALAGWAALALGHVPAMLVVLFLLGLQSAFFGPVKYAILPELLAPQDLLAGNALVEAGTFLAILAGTIVGGWLVMAEGGQQWVGALSTACAVAGWGMARLVPECRPGDPSVRVGWEPVRQSIRVIRGARGNPQVWLAVLGISWFWMLGATYLTQFPNLAAGTLKAGQPVVTLMLTVFSVGIGLGSALCQALLRGRVSARFVPWAALAMAAAGLDLWLAAGASFAVTGTLAGFLEQSGAWRIVLDLLAVSVAGGLYIVPLYTLMQTCSADHARSRAVAANNILNAGFMVVSSLAGTAVLGAGCTVAELLLAAALVNVPVVWWLRALWRR
jgi:acyl-[acyl-carrier-protein]-phospholipid O-acyltransferase/long-chain-fatty-acid--[acyl-carrier-protein] ligase